MASTDGLIPCSECGHIHYDFWKNEYAKCPLASEGCTCQGPSTGMTPEQEHNEDLKAAATMLAEWRRSIIAANYREGVDFDLLGEAQEINGYSGWAIGRGDPIYFDDEELPLIVEMATAR